MHHLYLHFLLPLLATANLGSTTAPTGGSPTWIPALPAAPFAHPEPSIPSALHEPSIPGTPVVSHIQSTSLRLSWNPPVSTSTGNNPPPATIEYYRIYKQEYQWTTNHRDGGSHGGSTPSDIHTETLRFEEITYSSSHPYANAQDVTQLIAFPGAQNISITFSTLTDLEHNHDYVQFLEKRNDPSHPQSSINDGTIRKDLPSAKLTGRATTVSPGTIATSHSFDSVVYPWPGVGNNPDLVIQGDRCLFQFFSDDSVGAGNGTNPNSRWGYSFVAKGTYLVQTPAFIGAFVKMKSHASVSGSTDYPGQYTTQLITGLKRSTSYRFIISARNNFQTNNLTGAWSPLSQPSLRTTTLATYPTASLLAPTVSNIGSTTMTVAWHLAQDDGGNAVTHFIIWQRNKTCLIISAVEDCTENEWPSLSTYTNLPGPMVTNSDHSIVVVPWLSATMSLTYDYTHLAANVSYQYRISAVNSIGIGTPGVSSLLHATETARLSMPPSRLQILAAAFSTMTVTWSPPLDTMGYPLLSYQLEISSGRPLAGSSQINYDASITYSSPLIIPSTTETHTYTSLKSGTTYHVRIRAMTSSPLGDSPSTYGASEYSEIAVGSTTLTPTSVGIPPIAPSQVQVIRWDNDLSTNTEISLRISWSDLTSPMLEVSHYHLYWRKKNDNVNGWKFWIEQLSSTKYATFFPKNMGLSFAASDISILYQFEFVIAGRNVAGSGPFSAPRSLLSLPGSVNGVGVVNNTNVTTVQGGTGTTPVVFDRNSGSNNMTIGGTTEDLYEVLNSDRTKDDIVIVNYQSDDGTSDDCLAKSGRQTVTAIYHDMGYGSEIRTIVIDFGYKFDVPPDIERLEVVDETLGRNFELTINTIWLSKMAVTIHRKDLQQGWSQVLKILWRAGAPANYKCSLRGALNMQAKLKPGWRLRVVLQTLRANVTGDAIHIYKDVTIETDPRLGVVDLTLNAASYNNVTNASTTTSARSTIGGSGTTVEGMFKISDSAQVLFNRVYLEGGVGGRGGCIYVQDGNVTFNDVVLRDHAALSGGAVYLEDGGRASLLAMNQTSFINNQARTELWDGTSTGGALYIGRNNIVVLRDVLFLNNKAIANRATCAGGAIDNWGTVSIVQSKFLKNSATGPDEGKKTGYSQTYSLGAGDEYTNLPSTGSVVSTPTGVGLGGALIVRSGGGTATILRCEMTENHASTSGGALYNDGGDMVVRDSFGNNNTARFGDSARMAMGSSFTFTNTEFLRDDALLYPESSEITHATSAITDDGRGWPIMSTGDDRPEVKSMFDKYSGSYGCPSGSLDRCLNLCAQNPSVQYDTSTVTQRPDLFGSCVGGSLHVGTAFVYCHALFEMGVGYIFIKDPAMLLNGYAPTTEYEVVFMQSFGIACIFWGLALACNSGQRAMLAFDVLWNVVWAIFLHFQNSEWSFVPMVAHIVFALTSGMAFKKEQDRCSHKMKPNEQEDEPFKEN